ncbi:metalloregulator ArsR/SmtB family transcription factor [Tumebacillus sp. DT12]|uniref:Metalloregulator ArsR/SmtB family transcription factor n=1 Tax=Tumebacillus lacus TaxID=2995335 RepID=A0ABT3XC77_9BACL|nr:metalloregulator ArsR/SmtB family transcription factor [Tumebacillus lacus]MCX7572374.1 metalloregulator ArsR/SmtB family transcription factor [Tumebacillus lacus]
MTTPGTRDVFDAIADPTRRQLLRLLADHEELSVTGLTSHFAISRPAVSKHLAILEEAGLVAEEKVGRERRYRLNAEPLREVEDWLAFYEQFWARKLRALDDYLKGNA